ncbi:carboxymuconolactone decarboxylase family protein [bacterium]|nr:carboxymuconolactone decarboxylase family protein [bacterium]
MEAGKSGANPLEVFQREAPEVARAFDGLIRSLVGTDGLDGKTKHLIYIALKAAEADALALKFHVPMAKAAGASRAEVRDAVLMSLTVCGIRGVATCLPLAMELYDSRG